jgi:hypothetical protein
MGSEYRPLKLRLNSNNLSGLNRRKVEQWTQLIKSAGEPPGQPIRTLRKQSTKRG